MFLKGVGGQVQFDGDTVPIERKGALGRLSGGDKQVLHIREIAAVQTKRASAMINGFIKFVPMGSGPTPESGEAARFDTPDENSVMFHKKDQASFEQLRDAVVEATRNLAEIDHTPIPDQISQLADLRDRGILTDEEFEAKKTDLLGRM